MYSLDSANPWLRDVLQAPRRRPAWASLVVAVLFSGAVLLVFKAQAAMIYTGAAAAVGGLPAPWPDILASGALQTMVFGLFLLAAILATALEGRRLWRGGPEPLTELALGLACGAAGFGSAVLIAFLAGSVSAGGPIAPAFGAVAVGAALVVFQAIAEEAFFRGWLQPVLGASWGVWPGLLLTAAAFAALHIIAGANGALAVANLFLGGLLFGLLALRTGSLLAPAAAHFAWNWTEAGVLGLVPDPAGSLLSLKLGGALLWSGGSDTMNGSLATTLVLMVLVAGFAAFRIAPRAGGAAPAAT